MSAKKKTLPYREGSWIAVPLRDGGWSVGLVARCDGQGIALGYFFGPRRETVPELADVVDLEPADAIYRKRFGDLGLIDGDWPVLGEAEDWSRAAWPVPPLARIDAEADRAWISIYADDDLRFLGEDPCSVELAQRYPRDGLDGAGATEIRLTRLLAKDA